MGASSFQDRLGGLSWGRCLWAFPTGHDMTLWWPPDRAQGPPSCDHILRNTEMLGNKPISCTLWGRPLTRSQRRWGDQASSWGLDRLSKQPTGSSLPDARWDAPHSARATFTVLPAHRGQVADFGFQSFYLCCTRLPTFTSWGTVSLESVLIQALL